MDINYLSIATLIAGAFVGYYLPTSKEKRGRLTEFKHKKPYVYHGHAVIDDVDIICCSKGTQAKKFYFKKPYGFIGDNLTPRTMYVFWKPTRESSGKLITDTEYQKLQSKD